MKNDDGCGDNAWWWYNNDYYAWLIIEILTVYLSSSSSSTPPLLHTDSCGRVRGLILHLLDLMETSTQKLLLAEVIFKPDHVLWASGVGERLCVPWKCWCELMCTIAYPKLALSPLQVDRQHLSEMEAKWQAAEEACAELERERDSLAQALPAAEKSKFPLGIFLFNMLSHPQ